MNERIRELGKQAGLYMEPQHPGGFPNEELAVAERFAQLIIEECARICDVVRENEGGDRQFGARLCAGEIRYLNRRS